MDGSSIDHYEEQLYSMFKSFDVNNEEALGESAVHDLCDALQLEERGEALVDSLFQQRGGRVTFQRFRSGLLAVLGERPPEPDVVLGERPPEPDAVLGERPPEPDAVLGEAGPEPRDAEFAPRFSLGAKRYGRRSRPALPEDAEPRASSAPRAQPPGAGPQPPGAGPRARRSASASATSDRLDPRARIDNAAALLLCRDLRMDALDTRIVERIFEDSPTRDATLGEFFERLDSTLARTVGGAVADLDEDARAPPERLLDEWERAGVRRPRRLLAELGFAEPGAGGALDLAALERALDAELREHAGAGAAADSGSARLLAAALALSRSRARAARRRAEAAAGERDKLRVDVAAANERAALLARDVDESHARVERAAAESVRAASARHADELRRARAEAEAEAERGAAECARLQAEAARRAEGEARLRAELSAGAARAAALESALSAGSASAAAARGECARLAERLLAAQAAAAAAAQAGARREAEAAARLAEARLEARRAGARAEELAAALEAAPPRAPAASPPPADATLSAELGALLAPDAEKGDANEGSSPIESRESTSNEAESKDSIEESRGLKVSTIPTNTIESTSSEATEAKSAPVEAKSAPVEAKSAPVEAGARAEPLDDAAECDRLRDLVKELEGALDAMRGEYEACEEYWAGKQAAERRAHDAELRAADARLAALLARVAAFERRLAPPAPPLHAIPEAAALEDQVRALQAESAAGARAAAARLQRAHEQLARARRRLHAALRRREPPAPAPAPAPPPACARCPRLEAAAARAHRAEAAARRLEARLLAADVLVKELYVENCHLAPRHPT